MPTKRQQEALAYIKDYIRLRGQSPTLAEIAKHMGIAPNNARAFVLCLVAQGAIRYTRRKFRSIELVTDEYERGWRDGYAAGIEAASRRVS